MTNREPTMLDRQLRALAAVHASHAGPDGPLDDVRRFQVLRLYIEWVNEALAGIDEDALTDTGDASPPPAEVPDAPHV